MSEVVAHDAAPAPADELGLRVEPATQHHTVGVVSVGMAIVLSWANRVVVHARSTRDRISDEEQLAPRQRQRSGQLCAGSKTNTCEGEHTLPGLGALYDLDGVRAGTEVGSGDDDLIWAL